MSVVPCLASPPTPGLWSNMLESPHKSVSQLSLHFIPFPATPDFEFASYSRIQVDAVLLQNHNFTYDELIKVESVTQAVCDLALRFGEGADEEEANMVHHFVLPHCCIFVFATRPLTPALRQSRPFGVALLIAGIDDDNGPQLYHADPSGTFMRYDAKAIGSGSEGAQNELQDSYNKVRRLTSFNAAVLKLFVVSSR